MLLKTAFRIILHEREKFVGAVVGVTIALFLMILQWGFYLGYDRDITVVLDSIDADIWVIPKNQPMFDGWAQIDDLPYWRMQQHPDISHSSRVVWGWAACRLPHSGGLDSVEVLGFEMDSGVDLRFELDPHLQNSLVPDGHILVGEKDREKLELESIDVAGMEINGRQAIPIGFVPEVHLFTTAGFVLTSLDNARAFLRLPSSHATYIVGRCRDGADVKQVAADLQHIVPECDVLTFKQFHDKAAAYWSSRTGIGPVLLMSSVLAVSVGFLIVMLAFYISTIEKLPIFACLKALGASNRDVILIVVFQSVIVFVLGCLSAGSGLWVTIAALSKTTISVVITRNVVLSSLATTALVSAASSLLSVRRIMTIEPGEAFRS